MKGEAEDNDPWFADRGQAAHENTVANVEAEAALLGTLMIDNRVLGNIQHLLKPDDFYEPLHGRIYAVIVEIISAGGLATPVTLRPRFELDPALKELGGPSYLASLTGSGAGLIGHFQFAQQIRDLADLRKMIAVMREGVTRALNTGEEINPRSVLETVTSGLAEAGARHERAKVRSAADMMKMAQKRIRETRAGTNIGASCRSIPDIDELLGLLPGGTVTVIGGRPGMGKSVLAQSMCWGYAANGNPSALISNEMGEDLLALRMAADLTHAIDQPVTYANIQEGTTSQAEDQTLEACERIMGKMPLDVVSPDRPTIEEIELLVARLVEKWKRLGKKLRIVAIDYLQIVGSTRKFRDPRERIDFISERSVAMAKRHDIGVLLLSQLSRSVEAQPDARPQLSHLKESGRIEEDATNVILIHRPEYYLERNRKHEGDKGFEDWQIEYERSRGKVDLIIPKARMKPGGTSRRVKWIGKSQAIRGSEWQEPFMGEGNDLIPREWIT